MTAPFLILCGLLLIGFVLRSWLPVLQRYFIPASVVGGFVGLAAVQGAMQVEQMQGTAKALADVWRSWPGTLIAVVFAGMLLDRTAASGALPGGGRRAILEGIVVWIIILGQIVLGFAVTAAVLGPLFGTPLAFGQLLEVTWAGGFGAAAAWGTLYGKLGGLPAANDLAFFFAAAGMLYGTVSGIVLMNIGIRMGWTNGGRSATSASLSAGDAAPSPTAPDGTYPPAALARVSPAAIDPLAFQVALLALAFAVGLALQWTANAGAAQVDARQWIDFRVARLTENLPLFLFTLGGGWLVNRAMRAIGVGHLIDPLSVRRLTVTAMEVLVVAAIASMRWSAIVAYGVPALILMLVGAAWCAVTLVWLSRRLLPAGYWFELGAINYGMATATPAQGMVLLRMVDRDHRTGAAADYALAAPLSAPFIGGGLITMALPAMLPHVHIAWILATGAAAIAALYVLGRRLARSPVGT